MKQIEKLRKAWEENNFTELFELLGTQESQRVLDIAEDPDPEYTCSEYTVADGALVADGTGYMLKHPFVNHHLQKVLARWAYRLCTSGGFRLPGFALADDGYLLLSDGEVFCGSDWIPKDRGFAPVSSRLGLIVRYPIRMKEDLLPFENLSPDEVFGSVGADLSKRGCRISEQQVAAVVDEQLQLKGTLILHSEAAARNGGDFDFDQVCVLEGDKFPRFVRDRFAYEERHAAQKNKTPKPPSPWWNLPQVAMQARGNQIGSITDLKTSCLANGRDDLAWQLVDQLQNALDQLKHGTQPDQDVIRDIRNEISKAPWLKLKQKRRIVEMDEHLPVAEQRQGRTALQLSPQRAWPLFLRCRRGAAQRFPRADRRCRVYAGNLCRVLHGQQVLCSRRDSNPDSATGTMGRTGKGRSRSRGIERGSPRLGKKPFSAVSRLPRLFKPLKSARGKSCGP